LLTEGSRLNLNDYEGNYYVTFEVAGTVVDAQNRIVTSIKGAEGSGSKILQADLDAQEARTLRGGPIAYLDRLPVVAGDYRFDIVLENNVSREYGRQEFNIDVPAAWPEVLRSSPPLLAWAIYENPEFDPYSPHYPYQVGHYGLVPALRPTFAVASGINMFRQIYLPRGYQEVVTATYVLRDANQVWLERSENINPSQADRNGVINHPTNLDLTGVPPGEYELFVDVEGDDRGGVTLGVTVVEAVDEATTPYLHMNSGPPPTDPYTAYDRAQQFRTIGQVDAAIDTLSTAVDRIDDDEVLALQIELMMEAQRYDEVKRLLMPLQIENPNDTDILMALAAVATQTGENYEAIRYYERIRLATNEETTAVLNPLASAYYGDGNLAKAREMLELSLQVNPEQPAVRQLLQDIQR
jgi:hypothetical protein